MTHTMSWIQIRYEDKNVIIHIIAITERLHHIMTVSSFG